MNAPAPQLSSFQVSSASAFSAATRVGGVVVALGYLLGLVPGPIVAVVGAIALVTYGRNLLLDPAAALIAGAAVAVLGGALGIAALRWGALALDDLRGVQSVLGPTLLVGPRQAAIASSIAAVGALVALAVWAAKPAASGRWQLLLWSLETIVGAFAIVTVFFDPAESALSGGGAAQAAVQIGRWIAAVAVVAIAALAGARLLQRVGQVWRIAALTVAGAGVVTSAALVLSVI